MGPRKDHQRNTCYARAEFTPLCQIRDGKSRRSVQSGAAPIRILAQGTACYRCNQKAAHKKNL